MRDELREPMRLSTHDISPQGSFGIVLSRGKLPAKDLMKQADIALYKVKSAGRDGYHIIDADDLPQN